jgi:hypothetical protein
MNHPLLRISLVLAMVFTTLTGCASSPIVHIPSGVNLAQFRYVYFPPARSDAGDMAVTFLEQLFIQQGFHPVSRERIQQFTIAERRQLLICDSSGFSNLTRTVVHLTCRDVEERIVYNGSGGGGIGMDTDADIRVALRKAFEGLANAYPGFDPSLVQVADAAERHEVEQPRSIGAETTLWGRANLSPTAIIALTPQDLNPSPAQDVFERVAEAVVSIRGESGSGTAFIITRDGLAITNHHVIVGQTRLQAVLRSGHVAPIRVLRSDANADVALLQIRCQEPCRTVEINPSPPRVGTDVYAIGNPVGLDHTLTRGVISGLRLVGGVTLVQTDAAVNPGNSGGPLVRDCQKITDKGACSWDRGEIV